MKVDRAIVFFDGICNLCDSSINILLKFRSFDKDFFIASLQGQTAKSLLPLHYLEGRPSTIILYDANGEILIKSEAILEITKLLRKPWYYVNLLLSLVPGKYLDSVYDYIAKKRYIWWGKKSQCRLPLESERYIFLP